MSSSSEFSSSNLGSGSLGSESPPQEIPQTSSFVSFTETPSMTSSIPSRQNAGEDASAISNAADVNENNGSRLHKSQGQSSSKNKNGRIPTFLLIISSSSQLMFFIALLVNAITEWKYFDDTLKYGYGISTFLQFELLIVFIFCSCIGDGCTSFFACFNIAVLAIIENVTVFYVLSNDRNNENCYSDGCTFLHGPYQKRKDFLKIHGILGMTHFIMTLVLCCVRTVTSSNPSPSRSSKNHKASQAPQKRAARPRRRSRSQSSSFKSSPVSDSQSSRASSYRSTTIKYNIRVKPSSTKSMQRRQNTTVNIPQKHGYPISSSYPQGQHLSTVCHPSLPPPIPCGYHQSFVQQQHFPLQNNTNNYVNGGQTVIVDVPKTEQPFEFIDIQRVVVKLPPLNPSESASIPPAYRVSSKQENEPHERVFCTRVAEFK